MTRAVKASELIDWTCRNYLFHPVDSGHRGRIQAWGESPEIGDVLALSSRPRTACYRVTGHGASTASAGLPGFSVTVEFVPAHEIENDTP